MTLVKKQLNSTNMKSNLICKCLRFKFSKSDTGIKANGTYTYLLPICNRFKIILYFSVKVDTLHYPINFPNLPRYEQK